MDKSLQMRAILLGGIAGGLLSSIPGLGVVVNCCCCGGFVSLGSLAAVYYLVYKTPTWPSDGDGLLVGLAAGLLAGTIWGTLNAFTQLVASPDPEALMKGLEDLLEIFPSQYQDLIRQSREQSATAPKAPGIIFSMLLIVVLSSMMGAVAGFLGMRLFRPLRGLPALPAPSNIYGYPGSGPAGPGGTAPPWPGPATPAGPSAMSPPPPGTSAPPATSVSLAGSGGQEPPTPSSPEGAPWGAAPEKPEKEGG
jgi:hypothetical protein